MLIIISLPDTPPEESEKEKASWLGRPKPRIMESLTNLVSTRVETLFDGAYFGYNGEPILIPDTVQKEEKIIISKYAPPRHKIIASNPGAKKVSRFLNARRIGDTLAFKKGKGFQEITHIEALNDDLIREVSYAEIFSYIGQVRASVEALIGFSNIRKVGELHPERSEFQNLPEVAFQVTKTGSENLLLINRKSPSSWNMPFSGDGGTFRRRRRATV